jgi:hypothetical protein
VGDDVEHHPAEQLLHCTLITGEPVHGGMSADVVEGREPVIGVQQAAERVDVARRARRVAIEPLDGEPAAPAAAREQPRSGDLETCPAPAGERPMRRRSDENWRSPVRSRTNDKDDPRRPAPSGP